MKKGIQIVCVALVVALGSSAMGKVNIETVPVGDPGNAGEQSRLASDGDKTHYGGVAYTYNIGKYEVTAGQYCEFLNAVVASDPYELYNANMDIRSEGCQITRNGSSGSYTYDFRGRPSGTEADWANRPVNYVSWGDEARFANWLHNGQPTGTLTGDPAQDAGLTEHGAYGLNGATAYVDLMPVGREADWKWAIPTENEWYKAAYYDPSLNAGAGGYYDYPSSSDSKPEYIGDGESITNPDPGNYATYDGDGGTDGIGPPYYRTEVGEHENSYSPYGTFDQGGNVWEWNEAIVSLLYRGLRGGSYLYYGDVLHASIRDHFHPDFEDRYIGFRVVQVPEPATLSLLALNGLVLVRRRKLRACKEPQQ